ncbi:MAG: gluconate 2-dehydrogenase subunit 3 family protein [Longimicrobiales bacterium]
MDRRNALKAVAAAPFMMAAVTSAEAETASMKVLGVLESADQTKPFVPKFFTAHEYATVRMLVDMIIPRDDKSGSATDAGVPQFMDFIAIDQPNRQVPLRGGLAWMDAESRKRFGKTFILATDAQRRQILDDIAWPKKAKKEHLHGVTFFTSFRDFTASGFYSSRIGIADLRYIGNTVNMNWQGCSTAANAHLGVTKRG